MLLIKNGQIIDPESQKEYQADLLLDGPVIAGIGTYEDDGTWDTVIDASGCVVAPGLVDVHVHFRDPGQLHKEDIHTGAAAAAAGGFTTVITMANTVPLVDTVETLCYIIEEGKKTGIHVLPAAAISKGMEGKELTDMEDLKAAGAVGFTDDGKPLMDQKLVERAMNQAARLDVPLSFHEEDPSFIKDPGINHGAVSDKLGIYGSPAQAEESLTARDCRIALGTGAAVNIQHISSRNTVQTIRAARQAGARVYAEVTPHHFTLTEEAVLEKGTLAKMNPPLRTEADRQALIQGLKDGTIDLIATDHAPHSPEEKAKPLTEAPSGIIGLETALALAITELAIPGHLSLSQIIEKMSLNPAKLYHLPCGCIEPGAPGDIVIFNPTETWTVKKFHSKSSNSPFTGRQLTGKVKWTICDGKVVYKDSEEVVHR